ncbi:hypothetical protein BC828DRAFT_440717 [Blastocladiella britannica]|nr:hypothetical protein BC828DRAFT_440717 [Blastocladiella britannica]
MSFKFAHHGGGGTAQGPPPPLPPTPPSQGRPRSPQATVPVPLVLPTISTTATTKPGPPLRLPSLHLPVLDALPSSAYATGSRFGEAHSGQDDKPLPRLPQLTPPLANVSTATHASSAPRVHAPALSSAMNPQPTALVARVHPLRTGTPPGQGTSLSPIDADGDDGFTNRRRSWLDSLRTLTTSVPTVTTTPSMTRGGGAPPVSLAAAALGPALMSSSSSFSRYNAEAPVLTRSRSTLALQGGGNGPVMTRALPPPPPPSAADVGLTLGLVVASIGRPSVPPTHRMASSSTAVTSPPKPTLVLPAVGPTAATTANAGVATTVTSTLARPGYVGANGVSTALPPRTASLPRPLVAVPRTTAVAAAAISPPMLSPSPTALAAPVMAAVASSHSQLQSPPPMHLPTLPPMHGSGGGPRSPRHHRRRNNSNRHPADDAASITSSRASSILSDADSVTRAVREAARDPAPAYADPRAAYVPELDAFGMLRVSRPLPPSLDARQNVLRVLQMHYVPPVVTMRQSLPAVVQEDDDDDAVAWASDEDIASAVSVPATAASRQALSTTATTRRTTRSRRPSAPPRMVAPMPPGSDGGAAAASGEWTLYAHPAARDRCYVYRGGMHVATFLESEPLATDPLADIEAALSWGASGGGEHASVWALTPRHIHVHTTTHALAPVPPRLPPVAVYLAVENRQLKLSAEEAAAARAVLDWVVRQAAPSGPTRRSAGTRGAADDDNDGVAVEDDENDEDAYDDDDSDAWIDLHHPAADAAAIRRASRSAPPRYFDVAPPPPRPPSYSPAEESAVLQSAAAEATSTVGSAIGSSVSGPVAGSGAALLVRHGSGSPAPSLARRRTVGSRRSRVAGGVGESRVTSMASATSGTSSVSLVATPYFAAPPALSVSATKRLSRFLGGGSSGSGSGSFHEHSAATAPRDASTTQSNTTKSSKSLAARFAKAWAGAPGTAAPSLGRRKSVARVVRPVSSTSISGGNSGSRGGGSVSTISEPVLTRTKAPGSSTSSSSPRSRSTAANRMSLVGAALVRTVRGAASSVSLTSTSSTPPRHSADRFPSSAAGASASIHLDNEEDDNNHQDSGLWSPASSMTAAIDGYMPWTPGPDAPSTPAMPSVVPPIPRLAHLAPGLVTSWITTTSMSYDDDDFDVGRLYGDEGDEDSSSTAGSAIGSTVSAPALGASHLAWRRGGNGHHHQHLNATGESSTTLGLDPNTTVRTVRTVRSHSRLPLPEAMSAAAEPHDGDSPTSSSLAASVAREFAAIRGYARGKWGASTGASESGIGDSGRQRSASASALGFGSRAASPMPPGMPPSSSHEERLFYE